MRKLVVFLVFGSLAFLTSCNKDDGKEFDINFVVKSSKDGVGIDNAAITVNGSKKEIIITTNKNGFALVNLKSGDYSVIVEKEGFNKYKAEFTVNKSDDVINVNLTTEGDIRNSYTGLMKANENTPAEYEQSDVEVETEIIDGAILTMKMFKIKFSVNMPVTIDMTIAGIDVTKAGNSYTLSGNDIIPLGGVGEFPQYIITDLSGKLTSDSLNFSMKSGGNPVSYSGVFLKK